MKCTRSLSPGARFRHDPPGVFGPGAPGAPAAGPMLRREYLRRPAAIAVDGAGAGPILSGVKAPPTNPAVRPRMHPGNRLAHSLRPRPAAALDRALLELHAVEEIPDFWKTARQVMHEALPLDFICLCLRPFALMPSTVFRERAPFTSDEEFRQFQELSPLHAFLADRPGATLVRMSDVITEAELVRTEFYRRFMLPYGEQYFACFCFWNAGVFQGMIGLHRTADQGDFAPTELEFLRWLHPHFDMVVQRILHLHRERAVRLSLEKMLGVVPIATVLLDWDLQVTYRNRSAVDLCGLWNLGPVRARTENCTDVFRVPAEVAAYCADFKTHWNPSHHRDSPLLSPGSIWISHAHVPGLRATVNLLQLDAAPLSMPLFMVRLEQLAVDGHQAGAGASSLPQLARLSACEREVATLVALGSSNEEIARRLHKSILTVKKQMRSIYEKLGIENRSRLIALLR